MRSGSPVAGEVEALGPDPRQPREGGVAGAEVGDVAGRGRQRVEADALLHLGAVLPRHDEPIGAGVRQRLQQDAVDDAEDGRVAADPERQRDDRDQRKSRSARERANGGADVLHRCWSGSERPGGLQKYSAPGGGAARAFVHVRSLS